MVGPGATAKHFYLIYKLIARAASGGKAKVPPFEKMYEQEARYIGMGRTRRLFSKARDRIRAKSNR